MLVVTIIFLFYAHYTVLFHTDKIVLQNMLTITNDWCMSNLLSVNCKKSQWMSTSFKNSKKQYVSFKLGNAVLERVFEYKYLGLIMDLSFQSHREKLKNRIYLKISFFRKIRKFVNVEAAVTIYKSTILPIFEYADYVIDYGVKYMNKHIQTLQNQGLYIVFNQHTVPYNERESTDIIHMRANSFRLCHRRRIHLLNFAFKLSKIPTLMDKRDIRTRRHYARCFYYHMCLITNSAEILQSVLA